MRRTQIYLQEHQYKNLRMIATEKEMKLSEVIRQFIDDGIERHNFSDELPENPKAFRKKKPLTLYQERVLRKYGFIE